MLFQKQIGITFVFYEFSIKLCCPFLTTLLSGSLIVKSDGRGLLCGQEDKKDERMPDTER